MAHEMDDDAGKKRELEIKNGRPVDADEEEDEDDDE
jgi:hypothetical protein